MVSVKSDSVSHIIAEVAAVEILPHFQKLSDKDVEIKRDKTLVTKYDKRAEAELIKRLNDYLPGSHFVGEESFEKSPEILSHLGCEGFVWVIDPIDGTRNFVEGVPEFATIIALVRNGETINGWIHDPSTGDTMTVEKGSGVWLKDEKMQFAARVSDDVTGCVLSHNLYHTFAREQAGAELPALETYLASCASFDYPRLFTGKHLFADSKKPRVACLLSAHTKPWDHLAGLLMVAELGGFAADMLGQAYDMTLLRKNGLLSAPNQDLWKKVCGIMQPTVQECLSISGARIPAFLQSKTL